MKKTLLPDVNFWLALVFDSHDHHSSAARWIGGLSDEICHFCRLTQMGFLRLANNPKVFPKDAVTVTQAWQLYDATMNDPRVAFASEPAGLEPAWRVLIGGQQFPPKLWNDTYLAAMAQIGDYEVVTFDRGFSQYASVAKTILS
jgi:toxin-antitoxin system PIN domain toxin